MKVLQSHYTVFGGFFKQVQECDKNVAYISNFYLCFNTSTFPEQCCAYGLIFWRAVLALYLSCTEFSSGITHYIKFRKVKVCFWNRIWLTTACCASHSFASIMLKSNYMSTKSYWVLVINLPLYLTYTLVALLFFKLLRALIRNLILSIIIKRSNSFIGYLRSVQYRRNKFYLLQNTFWDKFYVLCMNTGFFFSQ